MHVLCILTTAWEILFFLYLIVSFLGTSSESWHGSNLTMLQPSPQVVGVFRVFYCTVCSVAPQRYCWACSPSKLLSLTFIIFILLSFFTNKHNSITLSLLSYFALSPILSFILFSLASISAFLFESILWLSFWVSYSLWLSISCLHHQVCCVFFVISYLPGDFIV